MTQSDGETAERRRRVAEYVEAYRLLPESPAEVEAARLVAGRSLEAVEWARE